MTMAPRFSTLAEAQEYIGHNEYLVQWAKKYFELQSNPPIAVTKICEGDTCARLREKVRDLENRELAERENAARWKDEALDWRRKAAAAQELLETARVKLETLRGTLLDD